MPTYRIHNPRTGVILGSYRGETPEDALDACARDAGYRDHSHACKVAEVDAGQLVATREIIVRKERSSGLWHLAEPEDGMPVFGAFANHYLWFEDRLGAVADVGKRGCVAVYDDEPEG